MYRILDINDSNVLSVCPVQILLAGVSETDIVYGIIKIRA
jgi:hypothetical protein